MKRFFDIILSVVAVLFLSPVLIIISIIIKIGSPGGALFKQERVGKLGKPFFIYKFRSMIKNAESMAHTRHRKMMQESPK